MPSDAAEEVGLAPPALWHLDRGGLFVRIESKRWLTAVVVVALLVVVSELKESLKWWETPLDDILNIAPLEKDETGIQPLSEPVESIIELFI